MLHYPRPRLRRKSFLHTHRFQLGGGLLLAVLMPWLVVVIISPQLFDVGWIQNTLVGNLIAVAIGHYIFRSLSVYPGIRASYLILPTIAASFGAIALVFLLLRLDYNRSLITIGLIASILWYYAIFFMQQRTSAVRIGIVPFGHVDTLASIGGVEWLHLRTPYPSEQRHYDLLVADLRADLPDEWERFVADSALAAVPVLHVKQLRESLTGKVEIDHLSENNFGSLVPARVYLQLKAVFDFIGALTVAILFLPLFLVVAIAIRADSPGPALFSQRRVGHGGASFRVFKFRTMHTASDAPVERSHAMTQHNDPRITRVGRFLRRTRIDELPQVLNILRAEMSWIGPRPEAEVLSQWYEGELPFYRYRHIVKPGITGWAQVNQGHVAEVEDVLWKLQYDFYYIKNFSPWLDLLIVFRTIRTVFTGFGSR